MPARVKELNTAAVRERLDAPASLLLDAHASPAFVAGGFLAYRLGRR